MPLRLCIPRSLYEAMLAHAQAELPNECCGLLAGSRDTGRVSALHRLVNAAACSYRYYADERSLFAAHKAMWTSGTELLAIYHSHPLTHPIPSRTDLAQNFQGPEVVYLIISLKDAEPDVRGWYLRESDYAEAEWGVEE